MSNFLRKFLNLLTVIFISVALSQYALAETNQEKIERLEREIYQLKLKKNSLDAEKSKVLMDNCVIAKAKSETTMEEVRRVCRRIADNPTPYQKLKWGGGIKDVVNDLKKVLD